MNKVEQGQSFLDMVLQQTGSISSIVSAAVLNNLSITDDLEIGDELQVDKSGSILFMKKKPATAIIKESVDLSIFKGIGYMEIGKTFKVS